MKRYQKQSFAWVAVDYSKRILSGKQPACLQVRQACERFQRDFDRQDVRFDTSRIDHACQFIEALVHVKGKWADQPIKLEPFQVFIIANLFGWIEERTNLRRFREALILLPRKNGKSLLAAAIALYMVFADGEKGAEGYSGATSMDQAKEVFSPAKLMAERSPGLTDALNIETAKSSIYCETTGSSFRPVIARTKDGASPHVGICDELHQAIDDTQITAFRTGMGARSQPLLLIISTAGTNLAGVCRSEQLDAEAMLAGEKVNDRLFALIYTIDRGDDWRDEKAWQKANPAWGVSVGADYLRDALAQGIQSPAKQASIRTKHLNQWVASTSSWLSALTWAAAADPSLDISAYEGRDAYLAADISTRHDLTAVALVIPDGDRKLIFPFIHLPAGALDTSQNASAYRTWIDDGALTMTPGSASSHDEVEVLVRDLCRRFRVKLALFDPWQGESLRQKIAQLGVETREWPANAPALWTVTLDDFEADLKNGKICQPDNPVLNWCAANISLHERGVTKTPVKPGNGKQNHLKIDAMIAALMAYSASTEAEPVAAGPMLFFA